MSCATLSIAFLLLPHLAALVARQSALELTLEKVHDDGIVPSLVVGPASLSNFLICHIVEIGEFNVGLLQNAVQILMKTVE